MEVVLDYILDILNRGFVGVILGGIIGYLTSYYFKDKKQLSYQCNLYPLSLNITDLPQIIRNDLSIKFKRSIFVLWNSGNQLIEGNEISNVKQLKIRSNKDLDELVINVLFTSRLSNEIKAECINNEVLISFEYLNPNDGMVLEILNYKRNELVVEGEIKGVKNIKNNGNYYSANGRKGIKALGLFSFSITTFMYILYLLTGIIPPKIGSVEGLYALLGMGYVATFMIIYLFHKHFPLEYSVNHINRRNW